MPSYVHASVALVTASLLLANLPAPRMHPARSGTLCLTLMTLSGAIFLVAVTTIVLALTATLPGYAVLMPAFAALGVALALSLAMCWMASSPPHARTAADADGSDPDGDDGGGGGGGLRPEDDPPQDPGPGDGLHWDAFDRERAAWESARTPARDLVGV